MKTVNFDRVIKYLDQKKNHLERLKNAWLNEPLLDPEIAELVDDELKEFTKAIDVLENHIDQKELLEIYEKHREQFIATFKAGSRIASELKKISDEYDKNPNLKLEETILKITKKH